MRNLVLLIGGLALFGVSCKKSDYALPTPSTRLQNQAIKRTLGPNIVGQQIEFAYAGAILKGKLTSFQAEASIAGAPGTYMENRSFYTAQTGADVGVPVGDPSVTKANNTTVTFNVDTNAATLRYYYVIPEEARGKTVTITFTAKSGGESVSTVMGPYTVAKMDMKLNMALKDGGAMYISIGDTAVYNAADAATHAGSVDLVYLYRNITTSAFGHALVSPGADASLYLPGVSLPAGVNRSTKELKAFNLQDHNLAPTEQFGGIFIDDIDFQTIDLSKSPNYAINLKADAGVWCETADGKYRAYIFFNTVATSGTATVSMKRYKLK